MHSNNEQLKRPLLQVVVSLTLPLQLKLSSELPTMLSPVILTLTTLLIPVIISHSTDINIDTLSLLTVTLPLPPINLSSTLPLRVQVDPTFTQTKIITIFTRITLLVRTRPSLLSLLLALESFQESEWLLNLATVKLKRSVNSNNNLRIS